MASQERGSLQGQQIDRHPNYDVRMNFLTQRHAPKRLIDAFVESAGHVGDNQQLIKALRPCLTAEMQDAMSRKAGNL